MQEYAIQRSSRKCYASNRPLEPGERYISAIVQNGSSLTRRDFASDCWPGKSAETICWWKTAVPSKRNGAPQLAPPIALVDALSALLDANGQESLAYLLALLLVRRRILIDNASLTDLHGQESHFMDLRYPADDRTFSIPICDISPEQSNELQTKLAELLYSED